MDFIIIPSNRTSFGIPEVKGRSWLLMLMVIQLSYLTSYHIVDFGYVRISHDPFQCVEECVPSQLVILFDWFIASVSVVIPLITNELLFEDFVYFSYHYIVFLRLFLIYRIVLLTILLPGAGIPSWFLVILSFFHVSLILSLWRVFYVLLKDIEQSKSNLIAVQISFTRLCFVSFVKVYRSIEGSSITLSPPLSVSQSQPNETCPICFESLCIPGSRSSTSLDRRRVNASVNRPHVHGNLHIFKTQCNHSFHRDCLMKWISGKPIRVDLGNWGNISQDLMDIQDRRLGASCPLCGRRVQLKIKRDKRFLLQYMLKRET
jgi:hypothetical protein